MFHDSEVYLLFLNYVRKSQNVINLPQITSDRHTLLPFFYVQGVVTHNLIQAIFYIRVLVSGPLI